MAVCFGCTREFRHRPPATLAVDTSTEFCADCTARLFAACDRPVRHDYGGPEMSMAKGAVAKREQRRRDADAVPAFVLSTRDALLDDAALAAYENERF